ncbi:MAG: ferrous iron transporter B, partial [Cyclobacteriaceae bacterium]|nr:ferrous iron transporter B [Cyclobacteriaceae bacterium]MCK5368052.1 ferrous iron transporter B [Cyclobacteriaceae bacterium]MCK5469668.1 ferrous iron transporter B [Cyclobacteriaceae bacterium]
MKEGGIKKVALLGNPNSGKSSLFNHLTGLNQKVGNFPGVTVEKRTGICELENGERLKIIDLPGAYSLYPRSMDEKVVFDTLLDPNNPDFPDLAIIIVDASNIKRNLLLFTQIVDLGFPVFLVLNMLDVATNRGQRVNPTAVAKFFSIPTISLNARTGQGVDLLKKAIIGHEYVDVDPIFNSTKFEKALEENVKERLKLNNDYITHILIIQYQNFPNLTNEERTYIKELIRKQKFNPELSQSKEIIERYKVIDEAVKESVVYNIEKNRNLTERLDKFFTHKIFGYAFFFIVLFVIFQMIFTWAQA